LGTTFDQVFDRIRLAINTRTQVQLADVLEIRQSSISDAKRRDSIPAEWYLKLFKKFGLNPDWLEDGTGPWYLKNKHGEYVPSDGPMIPGVMDAMSGYAGPDNKGTVVTVHSMQVEKTEGGNWSPMPIGKLCVPQSFFRPSVQVVKMSASNMEPLIRRNAFMGIDTAIKHIDSGELYAVDLLNEGLAVKRVFHDTERNRLILRTESTVHPEQYLPVEKRDEHVYGRIVWVLQEL